MGFSTTWQPAEEKNQRQNVALIFVHILTNTYTSWAGFYTFSIFLHKSLTTAQNKTGPLTPWWRANWPAPHAAPLRKAPRH